MSQVEPGQSRWVSEALAPRSVVVVGHGMVGHRFVEALRDRDVDGRWRITVLWRSRHRAYDRVALSSYVDSWDRGALALPGNDYAGDDLVHLRVGETGHHHRPGGAHRHDVRRARVGYDALVLATGSYPFVPPVPGKDSVAASSIARWTTSTRSGRGRGRRARGRPASWSAAGCSGLEAANALRLLGLDTARRRARLRG